LSKSARKTLITGAARKILVTGDSWAAGEWDTSKGEEINFHARKYSFTRHLAETDKFNIIYAPFPGHGDPCSLTYILDRHDLNEIDYIIFVKTCATRGFSYLTEKAFPYWFKEDSIITKITWMNDIVYSNLKPIKDKLILLGGIEKIRSSFDCFLKLPSITEFLYPKFIDTEYFGDIKYIKDMFDKDKFGADLLITSAQRKIDFWNNHPEYFYPDGAHPNRKAHKKIADFILNAIG